MQQIQLPVGKYRFQFQAQDDILLPSYSGSSWRGIFGHQLKRTVCVTREKHCQNCLLWRNCVYTYLFETPPAQDALMMKKYSAAPHPFVIQPDPQQMRMVAKGKPLFIDISLIGKANQHLAYFIHTFQQAGKRGIGQQNGQFSLSAVKQFQHQQLTEIYNDKDQALQALAVQAMNIPKLPTANIVLEFITPYRARSQNKYINADNFNFYHLFSPLLRRISSLSYFHTDKELPLDFAHLVACSKQVKIIRQQLRWHEWSRYSSRQQCEIRMGGLLGTVEFEAQSIQELWEFLYLGQFINIGKGTVMGLGKYSLKML
jgi:hypothetical protein